MRLWLIDTNMLLRWAQLDHPLSSLCQSAIAFLGLQGDQVFVTPQNLIEFWNAATRPRDRNGFGFTPEEAEQEVLRLEGTFRLAPDDPAVYREWRHLVRTVGVSGVQVHDARLVAVMRVHGLTHILTLNPGDFRRYPDITVVHPQDVAPASAQEAEEP